MTAGRRLDSASGEGDGLGAAARIVAGYHVAGGQHLVEVGGAAGVLEVTERETGKKDRLNILFLTQVLPHPLDTGAKIRAYYMLQHLKQHHDVTVISFVRDDDTRSSVAHLSEMCDRVLTIPLRRSRRQDAQALLRSLKRNEPIVIIRDRVPEMERLLRDVVRENQFDVVHADQTSMAQFGLIAAQEATGGCEPRLVLDQHNAMHILIERQAQFERGVGRRLWRREGRRFREYERMLCREYDHILTVTQEDRDALVGLFAGPEQDSVAEKFTVMPICVDPTSVEPVQPRDEGPHILHLGTMFWPPNVEGVLWFAREIWPLVLEEEPESQLTIAGKHPPREVQTLAGSNIEVTGYVPDPERLLARSRAFIVPLLAGGGMRVKIPDGWQWGVPIVSTTIGAEGIRYREGENILLADEPKAFAGAIVRLLREPELRAQLRTNGRRWVEQEYDWRKVYSQVDAVYCARVNRASNQSSG